MVTFWYDDKTAELRMYPASGNNPWLVFGGQRTSRIEIHTGEQETRDVLARRWQCDENHIQHDFAPSTPLTFEEEINLAMMCNGEIFLNAEDGRVYALRLEENYEKHIVNGETPFFVPKLERQYWRVQWQVAPASQFSRKFREVVAAKFLTVPLCDGYDAVGRTISWLDHPMRHPALRVIDAIDHSGRMYIWKLQDGRRSIDFPSNPGEVNAAAGSCRAILREIMKAEWESFFPPDIDVVEKNTLPFYANTLSGVDAGRDIGVEKIPSGYAIAWESTHKMLLMRIRANAEVRCPQEYRGRIIGTKGVNIVELAKRTGQRYIKLV